MTTKTNSACHALLWWDALTFNILKKNLYLNTNIEVLWVIRSNWLISRAIWQRTCVLHAGFKVEEYCSKTFGMEEVKAFAQLLAPKYGIAVHNSLTANSKVFETPTSEDQKIVYWINLLNLNDHFSTITKPSGFFGTHYWCELCNKCYHDKLNHRCIPNCVACKTLDTEKFVNFITEKQRTVMTVTETFMVKRVLQTTKV